MQAFTDFILQVTYPPNPIRSLDNSLDARSDGGPRSFFFGPELTDVVPELQRLPRARSGARASSGRRQFVSSRARRRTSRSRTCGTCTRRSACSACRRCRFATPATTAFKGDQVRGFGFLHDGSIDTLFRFPRRRASSRSRTTPQQPAASSRSCSPSTRTWRRSSASRSRSPARTGRTVGPRIDLLIAQRRRRRVRPRREGRRSRGLQRGWLRLANGKFQSDRAQRAPLLSDAQLRAQAATRRPGAHLHVRAARLGPAHRHRPRRGRLLRPRRARRRQRSRPIRRACRAAARRRPRRRPRPPADDDHDDDRRGSSIADPGEEAHVEGPHHAADCATSAR